MQVRWTFQGTLSHLQLRATLDNFTQLPTELRTTSLQLTFAPFFYFHTKPRLLVRIVCMREAQTLHMCTPSYLL